MVLLIHRPARGGWGLAPFTYKAQARAGTGMKSDGMVSGLYREGGGATRSCGRGKKLLARLSKTVWDPRTCFLLSFHIEADWLL